MVTRLESSDFLKAPTARKLIAGDLEAVFLPAHGMLGASLRRRGVEMLGRVGDLEASAAAGSTAGIPLLHPWANRLAEPQYRVLGRKVVLGVSSPLLHLDEHGLPMHGVPWSKLFWTVTEARQDFVAARLEWSTSDLLAIFPFRHRLELAAVVRPDALTLETTLVASSEGPVPVSFGFHPYFRLPEALRANWRLELPAMRRIVLDQHGIPTGDEEPFGGFNAQLGESDFDNGFALTEERTSLSVVGANCRVSVDLLEGYRFAQVFAPKGKDYIALEPMTAPTSALTSGRGLRLVSPDQRFRAVFRIRID
ncbi:MAG TPA: aldose 1-epimerase [Candidatus Sulfotelmatobacter sp.]|jgi:aldose 1-epimerase|nr:aldose 1-epimerase [Candidatus Sulfotelmatobacter sp.]